MNLQKNMLCRIVKKNKKIKTFCLKRRLKKLENKIDREIENIIFMYPVEASRMDNILESFPLSSLVETSLKLSATKKLLLNISKN